MMIPIRARITVIPTLLKEASTPLAAHYREKLKQCGTADYDIGIL